MSIFEKTGSPKAPTFLNSSAPHPALESLSKTFSRDCFQDTSSDNMASVAKTIISLSQLVESPPTSRFNSKSPYGTNSKMAGSMSSPNFIPHPAKRVSPPQGSLLNITTANQSRLSRPLPSHAAAVPSPTTPFTSPSPKPLLSHLDDIHRNRIHYPLFPP